jgi:hypothetical protein
MNRAQSLWKLDTKMHRQVHRTDVVPELAGRQSISLVARSKKIMTSQLYVSPISHVAEKIRPRAVGLGCG